MKDQLYTFSDLRQTQNANTKTTPQCNAQHAVATELKGDLQALAYLALGAKRNLVQTRQQRTQHHGCLLAKSHRSVLQDLTLARALSRIARPCRSHPQRQRNQQRHHPLRNHVKARLQNSLRSACRRTLQLQGRGNSEALVCKKPARRECALCT